MEKNESNEICPLQSLKAFLQIRLGNDGPHFCHINGKSLTRFQFQTVLNKGLKFLSLNTSRFNTHSFRIGAATSAFMSGKTENQIKTMGRWMSSSFQRYIRIPNI